MKTFVLAAFIASAAFGLASAGTAGYPCTDEMQMMVDAEDACVDECSSDMDDCITCVMKGMGFRTDINAFEDAALHIQGDEDGSMACLDAVEMDADELDDLLAQLKGKDLQKVLDSALHEVGSDMKGDKGHMKGDKGRLYTLFASAQGCIAKAYPPCQKQKLA